MTIMNVLSLFGGLGLFLFGMQLMGEALEKAAGTRLKKLLGMVTGNRFLAMLAGITITAVVQSSSATTVMVVGFVNAGLMSLTQAVGVQVVQGINRIEYLEIHRQALGAGFGRHDRHRVA